MSLRTARQLVFLGIPLVGHMESVTGIEDGGLRLYGCGREVHLQKKESQKVKPKVC